MKKILCVSILALLCFVSSLHAAPLDNRIPADALVYIGWQGADALGTPYANSNLKGVVDNSKLKDYLIENWPKWMASASGNDAERAQAIADGQVIAKALWQYPSAFYVGPITFNGKEPEARLALLCDAGAQAAPLETLIKNLLDKNPPPKDANVQVSRDGNVLIITMGQAAPASFAAAAKDRISANPAYVAAMKGMRPNGAIVVFADGPKIVAAATQGIKLNAPEGEANKVLAALDALGLNSLTQLAYTGGFDNKEWVEEAFLGINGPRVGYLKLIETDPISDDTLKLVPKDAAGFAALRFDPAKVLPELRNVLKQVGPNELEQFERDLASSKQFLGFDLEKDLIATLGTEWLIYRGTKAPDMPSHPVVFVHKLKDAAIFQKTLASIEERINELGGGRIKVEKLDTGTVTVNGVRLPFVTIAWSVNNGHLFISTPEGIAPAIEHAEKKGPSVLENPTYLAVRKSLPNQKPFMLLYNEPAKLYPDTYQLLMGLLPMARMAGLDLPGDLLPLPKRIAPFLTPGGSICWSDKDGIHASTRSAFPGAELLAHQIGPSTLVAPAALTVPLALPALAQAREQAKRVKGMANLHTIAIGCHTYATMNNDQMPEHLGKLITNGSIHGAQVFVSPRVGTKPLEITPELLKEAEKDFPAFAKKIDEHCDFVYIGNVGKMAEAPFGAVMCYEKPGPLTRDGISALFFDGHVEFVRWSSLKQIFKETNDFRKKKELPEIDTDALEKAAKPKP